MLSYFKSCICHYNTYNFTLWTSRKVVVKRHLNGHNFTRQCFTASIYTLESKLRLKCTTRTSATSSADPSSEGSYKLLNFSRQKTMLHHRLVTGFPCPILKCGDLLVLLMNLFCCYGDSSSLSLAANHQGTPFCK